MRNPHTSHCAPSQHIEFARMTTRPIFITRSDGKPLVEERSYSFKWNGGFSITQKHKNINNLHSAARVDGIEPVLDVSSKSTRPLGEHLSAFNVQTLLPSGQSTPLECAFQGSKIFEHGGPYHDLYDAEPKVAKRDSRIRESGSIIGFSLEGLHFPSTPMTAFYDWLYIRSIDIHRDFLAILLQYRAFSDIEFNPSRSINCQARSCALYSSLYARGLLAQAVRSPEDFLATVYFPGSVVRTNSEHSDSQLKYFQ